MGIQSSLATVGRAKLLAVHEKVGNGTDDMEKPKSNLPNSTEVHQIVVWYVVTASEHFKQVAEPGNLVGKREAKGDNHEVGKDARDEIKLL